MRSEAWFKPKTYGYGATPKNWKGWLATAVYIALLLGSASKFIGSGPHDFTYTLTYLAAIAAITAVFVAISKAKTEGKWRWRWG